MPTSPVSPAGAPATGATPPADGYVLGVDLGTSHTVAVIRWPDGRARPLLVDGAPVMPSAVYLDEAGHIHVGRDAQRLAQTDPTQFEPNPKHRIGETSVLLGDREVPVTALLSAILREVAAKAVEAVGHLPPAVLTCPAKWGPQFRGVLENAAAQAGFPPVRLVPEPVAAAHYFAEVMRRPIPMGRSVAVFDFGGGTLDIAVVRHQEDGGYAVQADGGLEDLGGLDVDAALVDYVGRTINATVPQIWQQLTQPQNGNDRRNRRLFWDDVRGAKEMLSRTTVAPIPVPGVESSLHLTREELEKLAGPLLERAVAETQRVIAATGQSPDQLAGLFLVGGASRIPLVGRLLHSQLGIAPTVLEQPELPVAEGSLAAGFPAAAPVSPATTVPGEPYTPPPGQSPPEGFLAPTPPAKPWYRKKTGWIAAGVGVVVLAVLGWLVLRDPYPQQDMHDLTDVGTAKYPKGVGPDAVTFVSGTVDGPAAYMAAEASEDYKLHLTSVDLETGKEKWTSGLEAADDTSGTWTVSARNGVVYAASKGYEESKLYVLNPDSGKETTIDVGVEDEFMVLGDKLIRMDKDKDTVIGYNGSGKEQWTVKAGLDISSFGDDDTWSYYENPIGGDAIDDSHLMYVRDDEGKVNVIDVDEGKSVTDGKVGDTDSAFIAYAGKLLVTTGASSYNLTAYDLEDNLKQLGSWKQPKGLGAPVAISVCGETRVCVGQSQDNTDTPGSLSVFDLDDSDGVSLWQSPKETRVSGVQVAGETLALDTVDSEEVTRTQLYDSDFEKIGKAQEGHYLRIDSGSFLQYPWGGDDTMTSGEATEIVGLGARDGERQSLGSKEVQSGCAASGEQLVCPTADGYSTWRFRN
ncbi:Hsp70 family protein [Stackebrandtia nassauensis]|uniref:Heat shock protein 70 n=1 Tax=Stackebrandtia nassauensis (strain DSM 44728 / CIP 108903 / NRRL B-16338 / NBRC 102104 / LLR-40K-21) TaxID=446470 RepID=D3Q4B0_STANL|nr:Hsp70 family protein [Stackebrandtia nassauensis]ADD40070.1 Heat shock protein 70 [Stackebrandtia nassauensis DSM 44728]